MILNFNGGIFAAEGLISGIRELSSDCGFDAVFSAASSNDDIFTVNAAHGQCRRLCVESDGRSAVITFDKKIHFFRALSLLLEKLECGVTSFVISEEAQFDMNGPMYDVSQGSGVINLPTLKGFMRRMALMGLNMLMLYCEDSYEVEGEPYFGYMRGRYSHDDMKTLDDYADMFGIEMIPCIQTLAHLHEVLKWPQYHAYRDYNDCLLVGDDRTYALIEKMIKAASEPFRTKRIHIGMDEAWKLGQGEFLKQNGWIPRVEIMRRHLERVMEIVRRLGLEPMMWSDMFFNDPMTNRYYNDRPITKDKIDSLPDGMQLVYWDYYHLNSQDFYLDYIDKHRLFGEPIFAGGIWTWDGYGANWAKTYNTTNNALSACKKRGIREVFATVWGDCDTECDINATLLGLTLFSEHGYCSTVPSEETLKRRFEAVVKANYDDFFALQYIDHYGEDADTNVSISNPAKCLMWQDILMGQLDKNIAELGLDEHYERLAVTFDQAKERNGDYNFMMDFYSKVCHALALKSTIGIKLTRAYLDRDTARLNVILKKELPELKRRMTELRDCHRMTWRRNYDPLGWATFDARYGTVLARIDTAAELVRQLLDGEVTEIPELDEVRLGFLGTEGRGFYSIHFNRIAFASRIAFGLG